MKVEPGIYPLNGADENSVCLTTVDFALTYFLVSGELERSGVPVNLIINDAGGLSVLTSWAAGKFSSSSIAKFFQEQDIGILNAFCQIHCYLLQQHSGTETGCFRPGPL